MAITAGTAAILGGSSLLSGIAGGLFGSHSQKSANETNLQIARETNQQNRELFNQQLAWQEDMWNKSNAYNAPENQVKMLLRAGINPASVYGSGSTSPATMPSVPSAPQMQGATVQPVDYSFIPQAIDNGINAYFNNQILSNEVTKGAADAQIAKVQAEFDARSMMDRLHRIANDSSKSDFERETARMELKFITSTFDQRVMQSEQLTKLNKIQYDEAVNRIEESKLRQVAQRIANQFAPQMNEAQLRQFDANVSALYAAARSSDAQAFESAARKILTDFQSEGVKLDNRQKSELMPALKESAWNAAEKSYWDAQQSAKIFRLGKLVDVPAQSLDGRSYTNHAGHYKRVRNPEPPKPKLNIKKKVRQKTSIRNMQ